MFSPENEKPAPKFSSFSVILVRGDKKKEWSEFKNWWSGGPKTKEGLKLTPSSTHKHHGSHSAFCSFAEFLNQFNFYFTVNSLDILQLTTLFLYI